MKIPGVVTLRDGAVENIMVGGQLLNRFPGVEVEVLEDGSAVVRVPVAVKAFPGGTTTLPPEAAAIGPRPRQASRRVARS